MYVYITFDLIIPFWKILSKEMIENSGKHLSASSEEKFRLTKMANSIGMSNMLYLLKPLQWILSDKENVYSLKVSDKGEYVVYVNMISNMLNYMCLLVNANCFTHVWL